MAKLKTVLLAIYRRANQDWIGTRSSALAFQALFAIVPLIAMAYFVLSFFSGFESIQAQAEKYLAQYLAPTAADQAASYLAVIRSKISPAAVGAFGIVGFLYSCFAMIGQAENSLNGIWMVTSERPLWRRWIYYAIGIVVGPLTIGGSIAAASYLGKSVAHDEVLSTAFALTLALAPVFTSSLFLSLIYWLLPHAKVNKRSALLAGFAAGVAIELLKEGYGFYAAYVLGKSVYGSLAVLPILFLWLSLVASVFLLGGELCCFLDSRRAGTPPRSKPEAAFSVPLLEDLVHLCLRASQAGEKQISTQKAAQELHWNQSETLRHLRFLAKSGLITSAKNERDDRFAVSADSLDLALSRLVRRLDGAVYGRWELSEGQIRRTRSPEQSQLSISHKAASIASSSLSGSLSGSLSERGSEKRALGKNTTEAGLSRGLE